MTTETTTASSLLRPTQKKVCRGTRQESFTFFPSLPSLPFLLSCLLASFLSYAYATDMSPKTLPSQRRERERRERKTDRRKSSSRRRGEAKISDGCERTFKKSVVSTRTPEQGYLLFRPASLIFPIFFSSSRNIFLREIGGGN